MLTAGCHTTDKTSFAQNQAATNTTAVQQNPMSRSAVVLDNKITQINLVKYQTTDGKNFTLASTDNFETATLTDATANNYALKSAISASGMRLEGENGVYIHTKGKEGTIALPNNQSFEIKEVK